MRNKKLSIEIEIMKALSVVDAVHMENSLTKRFTIYAILQFISSF